MTGWHDYGTCVRRARRLSAESHAANSREERASRVADAKKNRFTLTSSSSSSPSHLFDLIARSNFSSTLSTSVKAHKAWRLKDQSPVAETDKSLARENYARLRSVSPATKLRTPFLIHDCRRLFVTCRFYRQVENLPHERRSTRYNRNQAGHHEGSVPAFSHRFSYERPNAHARRPIEKRRKTRRYSPVLFFFRNHHFRKVWQVDAP